MTIEYGYDKKVKCWCVIVLDNEHNEVENSYSGNLHDAKWDIEYFKKQYDIKEVIKIKAY